LTDQSLFHILPVDKMNSEQRSNLSLPQRQMYLLQHPLSDMTHDLLRIYAHHDVQVGWPKNTKGKFDHLAREDTAGVIGAIFGDEGKGRIVDNKIQSLLERDHVEQAYVIRFQGGNNSGHSLEKDGIKLALHVIPSMVFEPRGIGIIDRGMTIHPEDLKTEYDYVEAQLEPGFLKNRVLVSNEAKVCTDIERAEEVLNRERSGAAKGGTGRGMSPTEAHIIDRTGFRMHSLTADNWAEQFGDYYDMREKEFAAHGKDLSEAVVPDYKNTLQSHAEEKRTVGKKQEFLGRLGEARTWMMQHDMVQNTARIHQDIFYDTHAAVIFEGAQAMGLHVALGSLPDVTCTDTSLNGITAGTGFWLPEQVKDRTAVFKGAYESSVGARKPLTLMDNTGLAEKIRHEAHEYGTTTKRPRDILYVDLPRMAFNLYASGTETLVSTHMDVSWEDTPVKVATHYENANGEIVLYQPGLMFQEGLTPHYEELPGWDGVAARAAQTFEELPENAQKYLAFIEARTGVPIVAATIGPDREHFIAFEGFNR
jgi:adenylosuccinate synthase